MSASGFMLLYPEQLRWLALVGVCLATFVVGGLLRSRWRRRLFDIAGEYQGATDGALARWTLASVRLVALTVIVISLSDPRAGRAAIDAKRSSVQITCLLDRSRSMLAQDVQPNRLEVAKAVVREVVESASGAAVALVTFAGDSRIDMPLTRDYRGLLERLDQIDPQHSTVPGTQFHAGVSTAANCFAEQIEAPKILFVISDGEFHGGPLEMPADVLPPDTEVLVLGIGDPDRGSPIPLQQGDVSIAEGEAFLIHEGRRAVTRPDHASLEQLAEQLGGTFQRVGSTSPATAVAAGLQRATADETAKAEIALHRQAAPLFHWLLQAAVALLLCELLLPRRSPFSSHATRRAAAALLCMGGCLSTTSAAWANAPSTIADEPLSVRQRATLYNQGVRAYRAGAWDEAERLFGIVSRHDNRSLGARAAFNLASTHNAIVTRGEISQGEAIARLRKAIELLRRAIADGNRVEDARANLEIISMRLLQIQQQTGAGPGEDESPPGETPSGTGGHPPRQDRGQQGPQDRPKASPPSGSGAPDRERLDNDSSPSERQSDGGPASDSAQAPRQSDSPGGADGPGGSSTEGDAHSPTSSAGQGAAEGAATNQPLTDQRAAELLRRIRERADEQQRARSEAESSDTAPLPASPGGPPW